MTPHTQENFRKIDEEFDHLLRQNQIPPQPQPVHGIQVRVACTGNSSGACNILGGVMGATSPPNGFIPQNGP